jgi:hypothetical protein
LPPDYQVYFQNSLLQLKACICSVPREREWNSLEQKWAFLTIFISDEPFWGILPHFLRRASQSARQSVRSVPPA